MTHMQIRRISLRSLGKHGCLLGIALAVLPSLACGVLLVSAAFLAQRWMEGWQVQRLSFLGQEFARIDLVRVLGLERLLEILRQIANASPLAVLMAVLWLAVLSGLLSAALLLLAGLAYNGLASLTGGIVVELGSHAARTRGPRQQKPNQRQPQPIERSVSLGTAPAHQTNGGEQAHDQDRD